MKNKYETEKILVWPVNMFTFINLSLSAVQKTIHFIYFKIKKKLGKDTYKRCVTLNTSDEKAR